jgi:intein/homing endonuclease
MITGGMMDTLLGKLFNSKELDLRTEMDELFTGEDFSEKKGIVFIHRKLKRNPLTNRRIPCSCNTSLTVSGEKGCPYCFTEDANVLTEHGYVGIRDVKIGDKVLGKDGTYRPVTETMQREYNGELIRLTTFLRSEPITCTSDHVWFVIKEEDYNNRRFIISESSANSLNIGDYLLMPKISDSELSDITEIEVGSRTVKLTDDFLWVIGLWCAEGHIHNGREIYWSLNLSEIEYAKRVESVFTELFPDCNVRHYEFPERNVRQVAIAKADIARWFASNFKEGCDNKRFPGWLMRLPNERAMNAFNGLWAGDGSTTHKDKDRMTDRCSLGMTSREIIYQAQWILWRNGRYAGLSTHKTSGKRQVWRVEWIENTRMINQTKGFSEFENFYATKIRKIESYNDSTTVYDITVDGTHSFIVNNTLTHNCDGIGYLWDDKFIEAYLYNERYISFTNSYSFAKAVGRGFNEQYIFITRHTNRIEEGDMMFELKKDDNGKIISPFNIDIEFLITANKYMGFIRNLGEYTLAAGEIMNRNDYVGTKLY